MKGILLSFIVLASGFCFAEDTSNGHDKNIYEGNMELGGSFSWSESKSDFYEIKTHSIAPKLEYFVMDRLSLGGTLEYSQSKSESTYTSYGIGPSLSYYFAEQEKGAFYFAQSISFDSSKESSSEVRTNTTFGRSTLGYKYFLAPTIAFGASYNRSYYLYGDKDHYRGNSIQGLFSIHY